MGQKTNPIGFRLGYIKDWSDRWYSRDNYATQLHEDIKLRNFVKANYYHAAISKVDIERIGGAITVFVHTARPGVIIGRKGADVDKLRNDLKAITGGKTVNLEIRQVENAETDAQLICENVATQIERRIGFRRAMKKAVSTCMRMGAKGIRIVTAGRLGGAEMARRERYHEGRVPLHTLRADIEYGFGVAKTTYGIIGIKCWVFKEEKLPTDKVTKTAAPTEDRGKRRGGGRSGDGGGKPRGEGRGEGRGGGRGRGRGKKPSSEE
jgi:small subunit ribosomal protein S3